MLYSNGLTEQSVLQPGQELLIPTQDGILYVMRDGEPLGEVATRYSVTVEQVAQANPGLDPDWVIAGQRVLLPGARPPRRSAG